MTAGGSKSAHCVIRLGSPGLSYLSGPLRNGRGPRRVPRDRGVAAAVHQNHASMTGGFLKLCKSPDITRVIGFEPSFANGSSAFSVRLNQPGHRRTKPPRLHSFPFRRDGGRP